MQLNGTGLSFQCIFCYLKCLDVVLEKDTMRDKTNRQVERIELCHFTGFEQLSLFPGIEYSVCDQGKDISLQE